MRARNKLLFAVITADLVITALIFCAGYHVGHRAGIQEGERDVVDVLQRDAAALRHCYRTCSR
jgi:hypothetical protein